MTTPDPHGSGVGPAVVLVGPPGSGKTVVGRALARRWAVDFRDTDADVEATSGRSVSDLFVESGERVFRQLEHAAVVRGLAEHRGVLALGGGAVMDDETRTLLRDARVIFLDVGLAQAMGRLKMNRSRPLLLGNIRAQWQAMATTRRPWYEEVADQIIITDDRTVADIVDEIDGHWRKQR